MICRSDIKNLVLQVENGTDLAVVETEPKLDTFSRTTWAITTSTQMIFSLRLNVKIIECSDSLRTGQPSASTPSSCIDLNNCPYFIDGDYHRVPYWLVQRNECA